MNNYQLILENNSYLFKNNNSYINLLCIDNIANVFVFKKVNFSDSDLFESKNYLINQFADYCKLNNVEIMTDDRSFNLETNQFLEKYGFKIDRSKVLYEKQLIKHQSNSKDPFKYISLKEAGLELFLDIFRQVTFDDLERTTDHKTYFKGMVEDAESLYNENNWYLVNLNENNIGFIMPQVYPDKTIEGTIFYFGLKPDFRNKGYGRILHSKGLDLLKQFNVIRYIGSTLDTNLAMKKVFGLNNCNKVMNRFFYRLI